MTIQVDTGQVLTLVFTTIGAPVLTIMVQDWRRRRRERDAEIAADALRENEARERSDQHTENRQRMDEMTRVLEAAFGSNGRLGFLVHRQEFEVLRSASAADHARLNGHATVIEAHKEQIHGLRRDVDDLRRAD